MTYPPRIRSFWRDLCYIGFRGIAKSVYYNLRFFPFRIALKFPLLISGRAHVVNPRRNAIEINASRIYRGMIRLGTAMADHCYRGEYFLRIDGKLIINGSGFHVFGSFGTIEIRQSGVLQIGDNFSIGEFHKIVVSTNSKIGNNNMHAFNNTYIDSDTHPIFNKEGQRINPAKGFFIGDDVWIASRCTLLKGAEIADGDVIGAGSIINKKLIEKNAIYIGNTCIRQHIRWSRQEV